MATDQEIYDEIVATKLKVALLAQSMKKIDEIKAILNQGKYVEEKYWKIAHESINKSLENLEEKIKAVPVESRIVALETAQAEQKAEQKKVQDANKASMRKVVVSIVTAILLAVLAAFWAFLQQ